MIDKYYVKITKDIVYYIGSNSGLLIGGMYEVKTVSLYNIRVKDWLIPKSYVNKIINLTIDDCI